MQDMDQPSYVPNKIFKNFYFDVNQKEMVGPGGVTTQGPTYYNPQIKKINGRQLNTLSTSQLLTKPTGLKEGTVNTSMNQYKPARSNAIEEAPSNKKIERKKDVLKLLYLKTVSSSSISDLK